MSHRVRLRAAALGCLLAAYCAQAQAQETVPRGAGIAGGALLGAEAAVLAEAALGVDPAWAYVVAGVAGAVLGGYAGLYVEDDAEPSASIWMLAAGMGLVIPTVIWVGNAREEKPATDVRSPSPMPAPRDRRHDARRDRVSPGVALTIPLLVGIF